MQYDSIKKISEEIINCSKCPELISYIKEVGKKKKREFKEWEYWSKPVPGFGDEKARLVVIGLAPAAHGGNRTGRMFTGDGSGELLVKVLYKYGFANKPISVSKDDGLKLKDCFLTACLRCAPPNNKPTKKEIENCSQYLIRELKILKPKCVVLLGRIAYETFFNIAEKVYGFKPKKPKFKHGLVYKEEGLPYIIISYHPSKRNQSTGRLGEREFEEIFKEAKKIIS